MISYGLDAWYLGCHSADFSKPLLRDRPLFDVILTDPPYGVREASLKVGNKSKVEQSQFSLSEQFLELLNFAARSLVLGEIFVGFKSIPGPRNTTDFTFTFATKA